MVETTESLNLLFFAGLMLIISESAGHVAVRFGLPTMLGYIAAGILCGPYAMGWFSVSLIETDLQFFREFALAIIAFSVGGSLQMSDLRRLRRSLISITIFQTAGATLLVFLVIWWLLPFSDSALPPQLVLVIAIVMGAVSSATDPATVLNLTDEYPASGDFKAALLGIVAIDDVIAILFYSTAIAFVSSLIQPDDGAFLQLLGDTSFTLFSEISLGLLVGLVVAKSLVFFTEYRSMLGVVLGLVMAVTGFCLSVGLSALLTCMMLGFMVTNVANHDLADEAMDIIHTIQQPVFGVFFFMAGAYLNIGLALSSFALALALAIARFAGKYLGTLIGGSVSGTEPRLTRNLGLALLPAAGVMIGLTMNASDSFSAYLGNAGELMVSIIVGASLLNQIVTPFAVKLAIQRSRGVSSGQGGDAG